MTIIIIIITDINVQRIIINTISVIVHCCDRIPFEDGIEMIYLTVKVLLLVMRGVILGFKGN
jgi:hypothetical protein